MEKIIDELKALAKAAASKTHKAFESEYAKLLDRARTLIQKGQTRLNYAWCIHEIDAPLLKCLIKDRLKKDGFVNITDATWRLPGNYDGIEFELPKDG